MKYSLLCCEGDFLLVEKIGGEWFFKLLIQIENVKGSKSTYLLEKTDPIQILNFLRGDHDIHHEQYREKINYSNYDSNYKSRKILSGLIETLIQELREDIKNNKEEFLNGFLIPRTKNED
jgi:hypothetical protein